MSFPKPSQVLIILLVLALIGSIGLNYVLYQQGREYYLDLNNVRLDPIGLKAYPIDSEATLPHTGEITAVFFGDSRAADWPAPDIDGVTFINRGIGAQTTAQALGRFQYHITQLQPDLIIIQIGINDLKTIPLFPDQKDGIIADCKANIAEMVALARQSGATVILTTIFPLGELPIERRLFWSDDVELALNDINNYIISLQSDDVKIFDATSILRSNNGMTNPLYSKDFLHLNTAGYEALNQELALILAP